MAHADFVVSNADEMSWADALVFMAINCTRDSFTVLLMKTKHGGVLVTDQEAPDVPQPRERG